MLSSAGTASRHGARTGLAGRAEMGRTAPEDESLDGGAAAVAVALPLVALGGLCSIIKRASARLLEMPSGDSTDNMPVAPGAGVATTPHESSSTSLVGQRNRSSSRQLTSWGT